MRNKRLFWIIGGLIAIVAIGTFLYYRGTVPTGPASAQSGEIVEVFVRD